MPKLKINKKRGEFEVLLNKKQIIVVPSLLNIQDWEEETGKYWLQYTQDLSIRMADRKRLPEIFGMIRAKDLILFFTIFSKEELEKEEVAEMLGECDLMEVTVQYAIAICKSVGGTRKEVEEKKPAKKNREPTTRKRKSS